MPRVNISASHVKSISDIGILNSYNIASKALEAKYQYMISEVLMLRLFSILEGTISEVALKLACGATYRNGRIPLVVHPCRSMDDAHNQMLNVSRIRALRYLQWTKASFVKDSIEHVLDLRDRYYQQVSIHGSIINEMRIVRNHVAHRSVSTKSDYNRVMNRIYGSNPRLTIGAFLTSTSRGPQPNLDRYIAIVSVILSDITAG